MTENTIFDKDVASLLKNICTASPSVVIIDPMLWGVRNGRFLSTHDDTIEIVLISDRQEYFGPTSVCFCVFSHEQRFYYFTAMVKGFSNKGTLGLNTLELAVPEQIHTAEMRQAARVPVDQSSGLHVQVGDPEEKLWLPRPLDISRSGMKLEFPEEGSRDLPVARSLPAELQWKDFSFHCTTEIRHWDGQTCGVLFPPDARESRSLGHIVSSLKEEWDERQVW